VKIYRIANEIDELMEEALKYDSVEEFSSAYSVKHNILEYGIPINEDGTVTLYHSTTPSIAENIIESGIIKGGSTATGGMTGLALKPSAFFGWNKDWVVNTWGKGKSGLVEINVPYYYIRQPAQNNQEIYFEGGLQRIDDINNIWEPVIKPRDTFYSRIPSENYNWNNLENQLKDIWEKAHNISKKSGVESIDENI
jgi:hypothetical protein